MNEAASIDGPHMARSIEEVALREAGPSEAARTLTRPLVDALWDSGLMQFMNPEPAGGREPGLAELIDLFCRSLPPRGGFPRGVYPQ